MIDFEKVRINAYHSVCLDAQLLGCYFHFKQNLHRKLQLCMNYYKHQYFYQSFPILSLPLFNYFQIHRCPHQQNFESLQYMNTYNLCVL